MENKANINDSFFDGTYKDLWKKMVPPGLTEAECEFIEDITGIGPGDRVIDIMCGFGRHSIQLGRKGFQVFAFDNAPDYIEEIKAAASQEKLPVQAVTIGALAAEIPGVYQAAILMGNSFAFFDKANTILLLQKIASHLASGSKMIINSYMIAEIALRHFTPYSWSEFDGFKYMMKYSYHLHPSRIQSEHTVITPDGKIELINGIDYIFSVNELEEMFQQSGFKLLDIYATPRKRKFKIGDNVCYLVVEKN